VFFGAGSVVLGAVNIGDDTWIGAGSVVTKSFPAKSVLIGNPAKAI
jgi:acetyltransferase-like isoleucine patch superfamily enzyme